MTFDQWWDEKFGPEGGQLYDRGDLWQAWKAAEQAQREKDAAIPERLKMAGTDSDLADYTEVYNMACNTIARVIREQK
jgi:hypothetical protein